MVSTKPVGVHSPSRHASLLLPDREAVSALREAGFTTVVLHLGSPLAAQMRDRFEAASRAPDAAMTLILPSNHMNAYELRP